MLPVSVSGTATISHDFLWSFDDVSGPVERTFTVLEAPAHGMLLVDGTAATSFTQADIDNNLVQYRNNGDGAANDRFVFQLFDAAGNSTPVEGFQIAVLDTTAPVVAASAGTVALADGSTLLLNFFLDTVALGNTPDQLTYTVLGGPAHGSLLLDGAAAASFTQADIDSYHVSYRPNGDGARSDSLTFQVSNAAGDQTPITGFNIAILDAPPEPFDLNVQVTLLYNQVLGRMPDPEGFANWIAVLADGTSLQDVRNAFANSPESQSNLTQLYDQILGRAPDAPGLASWTTALADGVSLQQARWGFAHCTEVQGYLTDIFQTIEGRLPDMAELAGLENRLVPFGANLAGVGAALAAQGPAGFAVVAVPHGAVSLTGSAAPEAFDFGDIGFGDATIAGFDPTQDAIRLGSGQTGGIPSASVDSSLAGGGTLITLDGGHTLTLAGVDPAGLSAANFRFI